MLQDVGKAGIVGGRGEKTDGEEVFGVAGVEMKEAGAALGMSGLVSHGSNIGNFRYPLDPEAI